MAKTNADYQREHRQRQAGRVAELEAELAVMRDRAESAETALESANDEIERLAALRCKHPAQAVDGGRCLACGQDVW